MKIKCPACAKVLSIPETAAGKVVQCPCGKQLRVPGAAANSASAPPNRAAAPSPMDPMGADGSLFDELTDQDLQAATSAADLSADASTSGANDPLKGYAPPASGGAIGGQFAGGTRASLGQRVSGALIDVFLQMGCAMLGMAGGFALGMLIDSQDPGVTGITTNLGLSIGMFAMSIINAILISTSGQSVGKKVVKTRIVDLQTGAQSGFVQGFLVRNFVFGIITSIPCIGAIIGLVDLIMLFPEPHETLHDKLAKTAVVQA